MNWKSISFDWNQARAFLATAEQGSLSAAAQALGLTQPTLSRQVAALERNLQVTLFARTGRALTLTTSGLDLLEHVRSMGEAASRVSMSASGQSQVIEGKVSITASEMASCFIIPKLLEKLQDIAPRIKVEIIASNQVQNIVQREADIAIRHVQPKQLDLIAKRARDMSGQLYVSQNYIAHHGLPTSLSEVNKAKFIGFENIDNWLMRLNNMGLNLTEDNFNIVCNSSVACLEMVKQGLGIGLIVDHVAQATPDLVQILPKLKPLSGPVWIITHRELHTSRRIRTVFDLLVEAFS